MPKFTSLAIEDRPSAPDIPKKGFYVDTEYMYGDADGYATRTLGPFPTERPDLVLEFLNLLEDMIALYADTGKGGWDDYESCGNWALWFDEEGTDDEDDDESNPDQAIRDAIGAETEYAPTGDGCVATLVSYDAYWHDGATRDKYAVRAS